MHTIFYSWQSDIRAAANRTLIEDALKLAISEIQGPDGETIINPVIDRDTIGIPGAPDISATILDKIDNSSLFVADITLVDNGGQERRYPNPNVLIELGYAIKSLGFSKILLIQNTFNGNIEQLPFDLRGKRVMTYNSHPDDDTRAESRNQLAKQLRTALLAILPVLGDVTEPAQLGEALDYETTRKEISNLYIESPADLEDQIKIIAGKVESSQQTSPEIRAKLLDQIVDLGRRSGKISVPYLYDLGQKSILLYPTASAYFHNGLLAGMIGKPYDSIAGYMKAIEYNDPNPSLCFVNAGHRYRQMNDFKIALSFYEKSVQLNPNQQSAWFAGAQVADQIGDTETAKRFYRGFIDWYNGLSEDIQKNPGFTQQAQLAQSYIDSH